MTTATSEKTNAAPTRVRPVDKRSASTPSPTRRNGSRPGTRPNPGTPRTAPTPRTQPTRPTAPTQPAAPAARRSATPRQSARPARAPFVLLVIGLLGGGLVSLLLLNTVLAQGSFTLDNLRDRHAHLASQQESLRQDVEYLSSPGVLEQKARSLNMRPSETMKFLNKETGAVYSPAHPRGEQRAGSPSGSQGSG